MKNITEKCITHLSPNADYKKAFGLLEEKIVKRGNLPDATVGQQLAILHQLSGFELGRFLIVNHGLNGFWTDYVLKHPQKEKVFLSNMELFLLEQAPTILATQERFTIFKNELQKRLREGITIASIPCGLMSDLLDLDVSGIKKYKFIGCDIDPDSIKEASARSSKASFIQAGAWNLHFEEKVDIITSNGLNIYEPSEQRVLELYQKFYDLLTVNGVLITSFLTKPPGHSDTEWDLSSMDLDALKKQKLIFTDILGVAWQSYRTVVETKSQLEKAGFTELQIIFDKHHIFPTVIAQKISE